MLEDRSQNAAFLKVETECYSQDVQEEKLEEKLRVQIVQPDDDCLLFVCAFVHQLLVMRPRQNYLSSYTVGYFFSTSPFFRAVHNWVFSVIVLVYAWRCVCSVDNSHFIPMVPLNVFLLPFYTCIPPQSFALEHNLFTDKGQYKSEVNT